MTNECTPLFTRRDVRNFQVYNAWMFGAMVAFAAATLLIDGAYVGRTVAWTIVALAVALMVATVCSYITFLRHADELLRKVHLEALAVAFGVGVVAMMGYRLCERLGAPKLDVNDASLVMMLCWIGGQWVGARRYAATEDGA